MDEYIKREDVKKAIRCKGENLIFNKGKLFIPFSVVRSAVENAPTADVVPKSEVEKEIKNWQELYADTVSKWEKAYEELEIKLENAKAEVTMEIIEKIESVMYNRFSNIMLGEDIRLCIAELKKKYMEGE